MIKKRIQNKKAVNQLKAVKNSLQTISNPHLKYKNILFCPMNGTIMNLIKEGIFQYACINRGAEVSSLFLDSYLPASEFYATKSQRLIYMLKVKDNIRFSKKLGIPVVQTSKFDAKYTQLGELTAEEITNFEHKGVLIGDLVVASAVRALLSHGPEWDNDFFVQKAKDTLVSAIYLVDTYEQMLAKVKPDKVVMSHGIYIAWGPLFRLCRQNNIPVDVYGSSYRKGTLRFYHNHPNAPWPVAEWPRFEHQELGSEESALLEAYTQSRETQKDDNISLFDADSEIPKKVTDFIAKNSDKKIFCLFTNIAWDAFLGADYANFENMLEWLNETIKVFLKKPDVALIIKAHPAEIYHKTPEKYRVRKAVEKFDLTENILLIAENESVKPFWLYDKIDVGLIHISTVAIEMALRDIPVLSSGAGGHNADKGFTLDPKSKDEYFELLNGLIEGSNNFKPDISIAKKYMFYRFFREALPLDTIELTNLSTIKKLDLDAGNKLRPNENKTLDIICEGILNDGVYVNAY